MVVILVFVVPDALRPAVRRRVRAPTVG